MKANFNEIRHENKTTKLFTLKKTFKCFVLILSLTPSYSSAAVPYTTQTGEQQSTCVQKSAHEGPSSYPCMKPIMTTFSVITSEELASSVKVTFDRISILDNKSESHRETLDQLKNISDEATLRKIVQEVVEQVLKAKGVL